MKSAVALFVFRRPDLTAKVFERIAEYKPPRLFIIADGPREGVAEDIHLTSSARQMTENVDWPCEVIRHYSSKNLGFQQRFFSGLDAVFDQTDSCIILEDDCLPSASFFPFCEELLSRHSENPGVGIISGSNFAPQQYEHSYFLSTNSYIWGWATWSRTWKEFSAEHRKESFAETDLRSLRPSYSSIWERIFSERLIRSLPQHKGWDVPFSVFLRKFGYLNAVPTINLIDNLGQTGNGTNSFMSGWEVTPSAQKMKLPISHPPEVEWDFASDRAMWNARGRALLSFLARNPQALVLRVIQEVKMQTRSLMVPKNQDPSRGGR